MKKKLKYRDGEFFPTKLKACIIYFLLFPFISTSSFTQTVTKVLISGISGYTTHDTDVKNAFLIGYKSYDSTAYTGEIDLHIDNSALDAIRFAEQNNYQVVVRSYTGLNQALDDSAKNYPGVLLFMPAGSNSFIYVCNLDIPNASVVSTGVGKDTLVTGYRVEFFSIDPITSNNESSFSNGYIAGQIAFLANHLNITPQQARLLARNYSSPNSQSITYVQYGVIDLIKAVQSSDSSVSPLPVELNAFTASVGSGSVELKWGTATEVNDYGFEIQRSAISTQQSANAAADSRNLNAEGWEKIGFVKGSGNSNSPKNYSFIDDNPDLSGTFEYRLKQIDNNGNFKYSQIVTVTSLPTKFELWQNFPNPFNPTTTIQYSIPKAEHVTLKVYDELGKEVTTLVNENKEAGQYRVNFNGSNLASGIYFYRMTAGDFTEVKKLMLLK